MSDDADSFRIHVRLNQTEFADIKADLERYDGAQRAGRIRLFLRLGFAAATDAALTAATAPVVVRSPAVVPAAPPTPTDHLDRLGIDVAAFQFGGAAS